MGREPGAAGGGALNGPDGPLWLSGGLTDLPEETDRPLAWRLRLDRPESGRDARSATLTPGEVAAFARIRDAQFRMLRRRLAKALVARVARCHPDAVSIVRGAAGGLRVVSPSGWHLSLAGQMPHALIGLARTPTGVDIEPIDAIVPADAFSSKERADLENRHYPLLVGWVAKEAHGKACGQARTLDPLAIDLAIEGGSIVAMSTGMVSRVHLDIGSHTLAAIAVLQS